LSSTAKPLRDLLKHDVEWVWDAASMQTFQAVKDLVISAPTLKLFDPAAPVTVSVDASPFGLGAVLLQDGQPVEFASRTLTETQRRYAQIEKELLAVQFGMQHFHHYVYGSHVLVETDHKPLIGLVDKPIGLCTPRIQRMRLQLQVYSYQLCYKPGKELYIADTLSRAPDPREYSGDQSQCHDEHVHAALSYVIPEPTIQEKYARATEADSTLQLIVGLVNKGWPEHKRDCPVPAKPYWSERANLSTARGLLLRGQQVVVPYSLQREILASVHDGHFGETKSLERAKSAVFWPGYVEQIRNLVAGCSICQERRNNNPAQQYYPAEVPEHHFQKVATDFFQLAGKNYLLTVDYFSKWPCVVEMSSTTSSATIRELEKIFSDFGVPETLVSDNGPQFGSAEFRVFSRQQQFSHVTSSPFYPASNGFVERSVQTVKSSFIKAIESGRSLHAAVRAIRSTPVGGGLPSPSVLLQSRHLRGSLPFVPAALKHQSINSGAVEELLKRRQDKMLFHQSSAVSKRYPVLSVGQRVRVRVGKKWIPGVVKIVCQQPDSYVVSTSDGREFRRNRRAINVCRSQQRECPATPPTVNQRAPAAKPSRRPRASFMFPSLSLSNSAAHSAASVQAPLVVPVPGPATSNVVAPVLSLPPTRPAVSAPAEPISQAVFSGTRKARKPREWPSCSRSSARLAAKNRRSVSHSPARSTASNPTSMLDPAQLVMVPPSVDPSIPLDPVQDTQEAVVPANNE
jgi:hypothetical protein